MTSPPFAALPTRPTTNTPPLHIWLLYALAVLGYALLGRWWQIENIPTDIHLLAVGVAALSGYPFARWYAQGRPGLPIFELICLVYGLAFSVPLYTLPNSILIESQVIPLSWEMLQRALVLVGLGLGTLIASYRVFQTALRRVPRCDLPLSATQLSRYIVFALAIGGGITFLSTLGLLERLGQVGALLRIGTLQLNIGIVLLTYGLERNILPTSPWRTVLGATLLGSVVLGLATGLLENAVVPVVLMVVMRWYTRRHVPWAWVVGGLLIFATFNQAKIAYRDQAWYGGDYVSIPGRISIWATEVQEVMGGAQSEATQTTSSDAVQNVTNRFDLLHRFAYVLTLTPRYVPYFDGETYGYLVYGWIPRVVWADKPSVALTLDRVDVAYNLKRPGDTYVIGVGQLPEAFINFGVLGIVLVMAIQGGLFALLHQVFDGPNSVGGRAIVVAVLVFFLNGVGTAAIIFWASLVQTLVANVLIIRYWMQHNANDTA